MAGGGANIREKSFRDIKKAENIGIKDVIVFFGASSVLTYALNFVLQYSRSLLYGTNENVSCSIDEVVYVAVFFICLFRDFLDLGQRRSYIQSECLRTSVFEVGDSRGVARAGDDFMAAGKRFKSHVFTETTRGGSDEPDGCLCGHCD